MSATIAPCVAAIQAGQYVEREGIHYRVKPKHVIAFTTDPGEGCEQANFGLCLYPATSSSQTRGQD